MATEEEAAVSMERILDSIDELISDPPDGLSAREVAQEMRRRSKRNDREGSLDEFLAMF